MSFQLFFDADQHTAAEGPYARVMKTRKWIYISSTLGALVCAGHYRPAGSLKVTLDSFLIPTNTLAFGLFLSLFYMLAQYVILALQLKVVYSDVLDERFTNQRTERLNEATQKLARAAEERASWISQRNLTRKQQLIAVEDEARTRLYRSQSLMVDAGHEPKFSYSELRSAFPSFPDEQIRKLAEEPYQYTILQGLSSTLHQEYERATQERMDIEIEPPPYDDPIYKSLDDAVRVAEQGLAMVSGIKAYQSPIYRKRERHIDYMRVFIPMGSAALILALLALKFSGPVLGSVFG